MIMILGQEELGTWDGLRNVSGTIWKEWRGTPEESWLRLGYPKVPHRTFFADKSPKICNRLKNCLSLHRRIYSYMGKIPIRGIWYRLYPLWYLHGVEKLFSSGGKYFFPVMKALLRGEGKMGGLEES